MKAKNALQVVQELFDGVREMYGLSVPSMISDQEQNEILQLVIRKSSEDDNLSRVWFILQYFDWSHSLLQSYYSQLLMIDTKRIFAVIHEKFPLTKNNFASLILADLCSFKAKCVQYNIFLFSDVYKLRYDEAIVTGLLSIDLDETFEISDKVMLFNRILARCA